MSLERPWCRPSSTARTLVLTAFSSGNANATSHASDRAPSSSARRPAAGAATAEKLSRIGHLADAAEGRPTIPIGKEVAMHDKPVLDRVFHRIAAAGPLFFFAVATVEGFLRGGYDPIAQPISALAIGPRGW